MTTTMDSFFSLGSLGSLLSDKASGSAANGRKSMRDLHTDKRGAIMVMGLCMACFLIGALWFLIGIGDAIVFRDSMQEATDHAAFTSAVLHAKGMNFISACNLIMMTFIFFHIFLGVVNDILFAACLVPFVDIVACPLFADWHEAYVTYGNDVMKPACTGIHYAEEVAGYAYPWLGAYRSYMVGSDYGKFGPQQRDLHIFAVSTSLVPGTALDALVNKAFPAALQRGTGQGNNQQKIGLPVAAMPFQAVCAHIGAEILDVIFGFLHLPIPGWILDKVKTAIGAGIKFRYCNALGFTGGDFSDLPAANHPNTGNQIGDANKAIDKANQRIDDANSKLAKDAKPQANIPKIDESTGGSGLANLDPALDQWWGHDGPYYPWGGTSNGSPWQEIWAVNILPKYADVQEHRVTIAQHKIVGSTVDPAFGYLAEAEFYFDCKKSWTDDGCDKDDNAAYSVQWRARLRRLETPSITELIGSYAGNFLSDLNSITSLFRGGRNMIMNALPVGILQKAMQPLMVGLKSMLNKEIQDLGTKIGHLGDPKGLTGSYH